MGASQHSRIKSLSNVSLDSKAAGVGTAWRGNRMSEREKPGRLSEVMKEPAMALRRGLGTVSEE